MSGLRIILRNPSLKRKSLSNRPQSNNHYQTVRTVSLSNTVNLKFVQFKYNNNLDEIRVGYMKGEDVVDIHKHNKDIPSTMLGILQKGSLEIVLDLKNSNPAVEPKSSVTLMAPITGMDKILCIGQNYEDHCKERNLPIPKVPMVFSKFSSGIVGQHETVKIRTEVTQQVDWEVELVAVIGRKCTFVKASDAFKNVFGYTVGQDISSRDWQNKNGGQFLLGKAQDTFCPIGPWIITSDEITDPDNLNIQCSLNNVVRQKSNTSNIIHKIPKLIERISSVMTLLPGDIILTGTPGGIGASFKPPIFLKPGDVLRSEIENIGAFEVKFEQF